MALKLVQARAVLPAAFLHLALGLPRGLGWAIFALAFGKAAALALPFAFLRALSFAAKTTARRGFCFCLGPNAHAIGPRP